MEPNDILTQKVPYGQDGGLPPCSCGCMCPAGNASAGPETARGLGAIDQQAQHTVLAQRDMTHHGSGRFFPLNASMVRPSLHPALPRSARSVLRAAVDAGLPYHRGRAGVQPPG